MQSRHTTQSPRQDPASLQKLPTQTLQQHRPFVLCAETAVQGTEGNSEGQSPQINAVPRNKSLWHQQNPKEHFPSCSEQGPAGVLLTAPCKPPPRQPKAAGERVLRGSCYNRLPSHPSGGHGDGPSWLQMPPLGQAPQALAPCPTARRDVPSSSPAHHLRGEERAAFPSPFLLKLAALRSSAVSGGHLATWISRQWLMHTSWDGRTCGVEKGYYQRSHFLLVVQALIGTWASFSPDKQGASLGSRVTPLKTAPPARQQCTSKGNQTRVRSGIWIRSSTVPFVTKGATV